MPGQQEKHYHCPPAISKENKMLNSIRPRPGPVQLKNGFYIEVCTRGANTGIKIFCDDKEAMEKTAERYIQFKTVILLGEYKNGIPIDKHP
jgi:hypothetical protein